MGRLFDDALSDKESDELIKRLVDEVVLVGSDNAGVRMEYQPRDPGVISENINFLMNRNSGTAE